MLNTYIHYYCIHRIQSWIFSLYRFHKFSDAKMLFYLMSTGKLVRPVGIDWKGIVSLWKSMTFSFKGINQFLFHYQYFSLSRGSVFMVQFSHSLTSSIKLPQEPNYTMTFHKVLMEMPPSFIVAIRLNRLSARQITKTVICPLGSKAHPSCRAGLILKKQRVLCVWNRETLCSFCNHKILICSHMSSKVLKVNKRFHPNVSQPFWKTLFTLQRFRRVITVTHGALPCTTSELLKE